MIKMGVWMAVTGVGASVCGAELRYVDGRDLPLEGRAFADTPTYYERLPSTVTTNVNATARKVAHDAAGFQFRFRTDSDVLDFRWTMRATDELSDVRIDSNLTGILAKGIDIYRQKPDGTWAYATTGCPKAGLEQSFRMDWTPGDACLVYLPCYGAVTDFRLGVKDGAMVSPVPHTSEAKPVVFYGTSITQGGSASRPGLAWVSQLGRTLDVPVVNLGFSGSAQMELEMADHLAAIDASCYVLDCIANMYTEWVETRVEPFVLRLRAARPDVPIVLAERTVIDAEAVVRNAALKTAYGRLVAKGVNRLSYVPAKSFLEATGAGTVEGGHPNDLGMTAIAAAFASVIRHALSVPVDAFRRQCPDGPASPGDLGMEFPDVVLCRTEPVNLPELLKTSDGRTVTTKEEWEQVRRPEILRFFTEEMFGIRPVERPADLAFEELSPDKVMLGGKALRKRRIVSFSGPRGKFRFSFTAFIPTGKGKPAASFINICCPGRNDNIDPDLTLPNGYWPVRDIIARGYAAIAFQPEELAWDEYHPRYEDGRFRAIDPDFTNDVYACFAERRTDRSWGMISVWAWGASRILDWIETEPLLDAKRVAVVGHSRCGKTALWCGATDTRVALVCANNSGCCGAKLNHVALPYAEPIGMCTLCNPQWFCRAFNRFTGQDAVTPYDQHWLVALVAPRLVCIGSGSLDYGAGPWGEYLGGREASPAWELYGKKGLVGDGTYMIGRPYQEGSIGYHLRKGPHSLTAYDWACYMDFADRQLK